MNLYSDVKEGGRTYKMYASRLEKLGIETFEDFLYYAPFRYDNFSLVSKVSTIQPGEVVTLIGTVLEIKNEYTKNFKKIQKAVLADETGTIELVWFNQPFLTKYIKRNDHLSVSGRVETFGNKAILQSPEYEVLNGEGKAIHTGRLVPVYSETRGISSKWLRRQIYKLLTEYTSHLEDYLPQNIREHFGFMTLSDAIREIHFPESLESAQRAKERLAFDELFLLQLKSFERRTEWEKNTKGYAFAITPFTEKMQQLLQSLPFTLTNAQQKAVNDIFKDLQSDRPMNRLVQGDVGSGKTIIAAIAMYIAYLNGFQSVFMAPTEILAEQHFATIAKFLSPFGIQVDLATGSKKSIKYKVLSSKNENEKKKSIRNTKYLIPNTHILVGTHAVLSEKIQFNNLGLVVIDEQQRFGVEQRGIIREKGKNPHLLTMTATPIPRTVALTMYGDLDLSYLNEMPKGRKKIKTWLVPMQKRDGAYNWIRKEIQENKTQAFIICPFIEESENMQTVKAAAVEYERLSKHIFPDLKLGLLHGKMKAKEKDVVLQDFRDKKYDILVATPVVEVGIDIPNATIIMIEAAERFGLAQLHQLRGRVGRGDKQSYCLLFTESKSPQTITRLKAMETSHVGAELAELDLKLRGPGDLYGTAQSGMPKLKIASFSDFGLIEKARNAAKDIFPKLEEYPLLKEKLKSITLQKVSPD